jgi:hypothetical protein
MVVGVNSAYRKDLCSANGKVIRIERNTPTVQVWPEERAEGKAVNLWYRRYQAQFMTSELPPIPSTKPAFRSFLVGQDGRVWVQRHVTAERLNEATEGTPHRPPSPAWGARAGEDDEIYVVRLRVDRGGTLMITRKRCICSPSRTHRDKSLS